MPKPIPPPPKPKPEIQRPRPEPVAQLHPVERTVRASAVQAPAAKPAAAAAGNVGAFRSCLAGSPYPSSKEARLQKPSGSVGIMVSGGSATITRSSGSSILDQAARGRAAACASSAGGGTLTGIINYLPR